MHGGLKIYRGAAAAARNYVEADRSRADDYYLAEGSGLAELYVAAATSPAPPSLTPRRWTATPTRRGSPGTTQRARRKAGSARTTKGVRFVEVAVNGPKTWSLVAALHPDVAAAYDAAQQRAAEEIVAWIAEHATTRVGPRGLQVQVPVEEIEAVIVRHYTSRAGDPHRHLHLQINARVRVGERWRGLHTVGVRDSLGAINGIGHAAVMCDPEFRATLAAHGYTLDPKTGEVVQLAPYVGRFQARTRQIATNVDRYEAEWRTEHPHQEPGPQAPDGLGPSRLGRSATRQGRSRATASSSAGAGSRSSADSGSGPPGGWIEPDPARGSGRAGPRWDRRDRAEPPRRPAVGLERRGHSW